jgi:hypothetical protein
MFCSQCGAQGQDGDRFCSRCGAPLRSPDDAGPTQAAAAEAAPADWSDTVDYRALIAIPEVHDRIAAATAQASAPMSAKDFLATAEKALAPVYSSSVPTESVMQFVQPIYERIGIQTGKARTEQFPWPAGRVIVAVLCSLARHASPIGAVRQGRDGVVIDATLPSSALALKTTLVVTVTRKPQGTSVEVAAASKGQLYDWGRSKRTIQTVFDDIAALAPANVVG